MKRPLLLVEALAVRNDSGLGKLVRMFVEGLRGLSDQSEILVVIPKETNFKPGSHCQLIRVNSRPMRLWTQFAFPYLIQKLRPEGVLCLGWTIPVLRPKAKYGLLIADVGPLENLGFAMSSHDPANAKWLRRMPVKADLILTNAEITRERMVSLLGIDSEKIKVVRPINRIGISNPKLSQSGSTPNGPYFLAIGNVEPRKNFHGLIAAYAKLKRKHDNTPPLYIAGHKAWGYAQAQEAAHQHGVMDAVFFTGYLSDSNRNAYLANCSLFISSSLYEGWGLPLFEALVLEKPAIYHKGSSQEEFARGFALATDCGDPVQLAAAMELLWLNTEENQKLREVIRTQFPMVLDYDLEGALKAAVLPLISKAST